MTHLNSADFTLMALSPVDGRYADKADDLHPCASRIKGYRHPADQIMMRVWSVDNSATKQAQNALIELRHAFNHKVTLNVMSNVTLFITLPSSMKARVNIWHIKNSTSLQHDTS